MSKSKDATSGYKKRLARRASGNPGPRQMWVPAILHNAQGEPYGHPLAAQRITPEEARKIQAAERGEP